MAIIRDWIEPGTTIISDCWPALRDLESQGYTHRTVNHSTYFVDLNTGAHTNTIEFKWRSIKVFLGAIQQVGRLPPRALHVRGEVQGTRRTTFCTIPSSRREHELVAVRCSTPATHTPTLSSTSKPHKIRTT